MNVKVGVVYRFVFLRHGSAARLPAETSHNQGRTPYQQVNGRRLARRKELRSGRHRSR